MKRFALTFMIFVVATMASTVTEAALVTDDEDADDYVYTAAEVMPRYPGGDEALMKFVRSNTNYPQSAKEQGIEGSVVVQFVVTKSGKIGEAKVVRSIDDELDAEAVRVVKLLPDFRPGRKDGKPVNVWYTLPVSFRIDATL